MRSRTVHVTLLALFALLVLATPASAKGPQEAVLTGPGLEKPIKFLDQSVAPDGNPAPMDLMGVALFSSSSPRRAPDDPGPAYTITWHMIDETVIAQHVYLGAEGGALIHTPDQTAAENWGLQPGWRQAPRGLEEAVNALVEWGQPPVAVSTGDWDLPVILVVAVGALILWGRRVPDYGAQASISLARDATV